MYKLYVEDILLFKGTFSECDKYIRKYMCTGYCIVKEKGVMFMRKQVQKFWKLDWEQEDKMESLMILGYLTFEDYKTQSTIYYDVNNDCIPVNENIIKNGARNLSGDYFYGTKEQFTRFLNYKL